MSGIPGGTRLERRKQIRVRLRTDLTHTPQRSEGRAGFVVKDPVRLRYFRFKEREYFLLRLLDGHRTLEAICAAYEKAFRPDRLKLEDLEAFAQRLQAAGLAESESAGADRLAWQRQRRQRRNEWFRALTNVLYIKLPLYDPDRLLTRVLPFFAWIFTPWFFILGTGAVGGALLLVTSHFDIFRERLPSFHDFFRAETVVYLWLALGLVKILHEFGHGLSCKALGGEVHEMGILFLCLSPCLYCNVSDAWTLPSKWRRMAVHLAGIYVELLVAAFAAFVWWNSPASPLLHRLSMYVMVACSISTLVFNANPLLRYDGYHVLSDWLEIPNLGERAERFFRLQAARHALGLQTPAESAPTRRQWLFFIFAVTSYAYRWTLTFSLLWFAYQFLAPYGLGALAGVFAGFTAALMIGRPLLGLGRWLYECGRIPDMQPLRVARSAVVLATLLLGFFLLPLPVSYIRQQGLVQFPPDSAEAVFVPLPAVLEQIHVRDGQIVESGDLLAEFRSIDLENRRDEVAGQLAVWQVQRRALQDQAGRATDPAERARLEVARSSADGQGRLLARQAVVYGKVAQRLELRAPRAGVVLAAPRIEQLGRRWETEPAQPFCRIGDPGRRRVLVPVGPADYQLLQQDFSPEANGEVRIRVPGAGARIWTGRRVALPEAEAKTLPISLTNRGGGALAARKGPTPDSAIPQTQQYVVAVDFEDPDGIVCTGCLAQVSFHCRWQTSAWWLWRLLASTFDLELH